MSSQINQNAHLISTFTLNILGALIFEPQFLHVNVHRMCLDSIYL